MSVQRDSPKEQVKGYEDYHAQHIQNVYNVQGAEVSETESAFRFEPLGGLSRGEVAELVAFVSHGIFSFGDNNAGGLDSVQDPGAIHCIFELSMDGDAQLIGGDQGEGLDTDKTNIDGTNLDLAGRMPTDASDILWWNYNHNHWPFNDTGNGSGGGGTMHMDHGHLNFREMFERGPLFDQNDELHEHISLHNNADNAPAFFYVNYTLYWRIHNVDDPLDDL